MIWIIVTVLIALVVLFFLFDTGRMKRMQAEIRKACIEEGLSYDEANKVAWYLVDIFI